MNYWCDKASLKLITRQCQINKNTAVSWSKLFRNILKKQLVQSAPMIGGPGKVVEIDESKFGKRKYHRGHRVEGCWVFGGVERESGRAFMIPVKKRSAAYLIPIIRHFVAPGTTIISDCWRAYSGLNQEGFNHLMVNHSLNFKDPETGAHTNTIECLWRHAKEVAGSYSRRKHLMDGHLAKYLFLKQCRADDADAFNLLCRLSGEYARAEEGSQRCQDYQALLDQLERLVPDEQDELLMPEDETDSKDSEPDAAALSDSDSEWEPMSESDED